MTIDGSLEKPIESKSTLHETRTAQLSLPDQVKEDEPCVSSIIGDSGPWQFKFVCFYMIVYLISPFQNYGIIFYAARADFWCADSAQVSRQKPISFDLICFHLQKNQT
jgi:hypothetical protein